MAFAFDQEDYFLNEWTMRAVDITLILMQISNILMNFGISYSIRQAYVAETNIKEVQVNQADSPVLETDGT